MHSGAHVPRAHSLPVWYHTMFKTTSCGTTVPSPPGIIISVKTRSERQILRLKQINLQLATKIQHLEFSCTEKVSLQVVPLLSPLAHC